jgi:hypothetical protein
MVAGVLVAAGVCAYGVVVGRRGLSKAHRLAFKAGLVGLLAVPLWFLGLIGLLGQLFFAEMTSPSGILFLTASAVLLAASACVALARPVVPCN